ncbi:MAG: tetratricopeptide repeat protein [Treponema sp.]|nr:tetratricopeptide repeat protein [Treponema sp.]
MIERSDKLNNQAILLASDGSYTEAIACFKRAIIIEQNNYLLWYNLGVTYRDCGKLEEAVAAMKKAWQLKGDNWDVLETLATLCLQLKKIDDAMYYANVGLHLFPENAHFWNLMGVCFFQEKQYVEASESFELAVSQNPYYEDALYNLRDCYEELGNKKGMMICDQQLKSLS